LNPACLAVASATLPTRPVEVDVGSIDDLRGWRRIVVDLELPVRDGTGPAMRTANVSEIGGVRETGGGLGLASPWSSASFTPLFREGQGTARNRGTPLPDTPLPERRRRDRVRVSGTRR
jgi:hypothetical protein